MSYLVDPVVIKKQILKYTQTKILWLDTEVADYNSHHPRLSLIQILADRGDRTGETSCILDVLDNHEIQDYFIQEIMMNPEIEKVFHNASFDLKFLGKEQAKNVTCTYKLAQKIPNHYLKTPNLKLKTLAEKLCYFKPEYKEEQSGDWGIRPLSANQIYYAKMDVIYLAHVHFRLQDLYKLSNPHPETEDLDALTSRYRQLEWQLTPLNSELEHLKERIIKAMEVQNIKDTLTGFKLSTSNRTTIKVSFQALVELVVSYGIELDFDINLTKEIQTQIGSLIEELPLEKKPTQSKSLKISPPEDLENIPF